MPEKISSIRHKSETRAHIPSKEEAGYEEASPKVQLGAESLELPKNPVVHRGQDPELFWMNKYGADDASDVLTVDIRSLYRYEHIAPEKLIEGLHRVVEEQPQAEQFDLFSTNELFGNALEKDELEKVSDYYSHEDGWTNRLIQGDSHLVMASLLEREGMAGQVQMIYIDPPYGIKYNSNWQMRLNDRNVKDGSDEHLTGEPEMIKAFRDTWELGIHSYLSYLRDRLLIARELLTETGSCFVQISDENVHLVRCLMDEVFGSENFIGQIPFYKTASQTSNQLASTVDYLIWYGKDSSQTKYRQLYQEKSFETDNSGVYDKVELPDGTRRKMNAEEKLNLELLPNGSKIYRISSLTSQSGGKTSSFQVDFDGKKYLPGVGYWKTNENGMRSLIKKNRVVISGKSLAYVRFIDDFPVYAINNLWKDTGTGSFTDPKKYVVQTGTKTVQRCILMTTDPGDLVLDPTCGSGTTAYVAEQWGRRWITVDTSRIALNIAKTRLMTATFPYYHLYSDVRVEVAEKDGKIRKSIAEKHASDKTGDIRQGFVYEEVPHVTLKSLANDEPPATETLYDKPYTDKTKLRVCGPFTVETLQNYEPASPDEVAASAGDETLAGFEERVFEHLKSAGVKNGIRNEQAVFIRIERLTSTALHAEGFYQTASGEKKAYFHIGPKFGTVSKQAVNDAIKECRQRGDANWLVILGFSFESDIQSSTQTTSLGAFEVTKARMHDDLMQDGLLKKDKKAGSFITIGEPDIRLRKTGSEATVEICGLDIYDPIKDEVKSRNVADIAYWMVDDNYDGSNFIVRQLFFCGGNRDEFAQWQKGLNTLAKTGAKRKAEKTLKIEIDEEAFDRLYGFQSHPIPATPGRKIAVRVISQFGEESMKVLEV
ncbi:MAG: site-specific DNA-methyltransferase [Chlorobiaceae bacterium]|nr:site-specific DNA-methyltransferase [Chlorobiaceae bacterium]